MDEFKRGDRVWFVTRKTVPTGFFSSKVVEEAAPAVVVGRSLLWDRPRVRFESGLVREVDADRLERRDPVVERVLVHR